VPYAEKLLNTLFLKLFSGFAQPSRLGWLLILFFGVSLGAQAGEATDRLKAFFDEQGAMRAHFVQTVQGAAFDQPEESSGVLMMQRPGRFRWDYEKPYKQEIVADGKRLWIYDVDLDQVVVKPMSEALGDTPAMLLSGEGNLEERFQIHELAPTEGGLLWVELIPKQKESGFESLRLAFKGADLARMELTDSFGQVTRLRFSQLERHVHLPPDTFRFVPPKGVDVVGDSGL
jgi:outer membrane lipoprotein carrier protein